MVFIFFFIKYILSLEKNFSIIAIESSFPASSQEELNSLNENFLNIFSSIHIWSNPDDKEKENQVSTLDNHIWTIFQEIDQIFPKAKANQNSLSL